MATPPSRPTGPSSGPPASSPAGPPDSPDWAAVRALFHQLADLAPAEREAALVASTASAATQQEVRSLLALSLIHISEPTRPY